MWSSPLGQPCELCQSCLRGGFSLTSVSKLKVTLRGSLRFALDLRWCRRLTFEPDGREEQGLRSPDAVDLSSDFDDVLAESLVLYAVVRIGEFALEIVAVDLPRSELPGVTQASTPRLRLAEHPRCLCQGVSSNRRRVRGDAGSAPRHEAKKQSRDKNSTCTDQKLPPKLTHAEDRISPACKEFRIPSSLRAAIRRMAR